MPMFCQKGCKDIDGKPVQLKSGKIISTKQGRKIRMYCPKCFNSIYVDEPRLD
jgi:hypothetical protein